MPLFTAGLILQLPIVFVLQKKIIICIANKSFNEYYKRLLNLKFCLFRVCTFIMYLLYVKKNFYSFSNL